MSPISSARTRTPGRGHLTLVHSARDRRDLREQVVLPPSKALTEFVVAAAARGVDAADAVRLGIERALALADAELFSLDAQTAASFLRVAASAARPHRQLAPRQAAYVRRLGSSKAVPAADTSAGLKVSIPERVLTRARSNVDPRSLRPEAVEDMLSWEIAATLEGRRLGEWALSALAQARRAA
jgi:hypothetical protein